MRDPLTTSCLWSTHPRNGHEITPDGWNPAGAFLLPVLQALGFEHVLMSGSGSTIFCIGSPTTAGPWSEDFANKWAALVVDTHFINRPVGSHEWYTEA